MDTSNGGFFTRAGNTFLDTLDQLKDRVIEREFSEEASERNEGPGEFANPNTVSQPVTPSQLPSGQPFLSNIIPLGLSPGIALLGGTALLALLLLRLSRGK